MAKAGSEETLEGSPGVGPENALALSPGKPFDPLRLSTVWKDINWSRAIFPGALLYDDAEPLSQGLDGYYWLREAEIAHCRWAMMGVLGYVATDLGLRFPGAQFQGFSAAEAHDKMVASGNMMVMLLAAGFLEFFRGITIWDFTRGFYAEREPGDYNFDPLNFYKNKNDSTKDAMRARELKNGRLAMLAFGGIVTQAVLNDGGFPYYQF